MRFAAPPAFELRDQWHLRHTKIAAVTAMFTLCTLASSVLGTWGDTAMFAAAAAACWVWLWFERPRATALLLDARGVTLAPHSAAPRTVPWSDVEAFVCIPDSGGMHRVGVVASQPWREAHPPPVVHLPGSFGGRFVARIDRRAGGPVAGTSALCYARPGRIRELSAAVAAFAPRLGFTHAAHGFCRPRATR
ncbi:hypothetical protein [Yinghuangia soli]|uniref:PH domain-containing protein n=1 Tax=Yinghuangia soli TaxID=2908204 RepID=A0AA41PY35_9ACTN|nr:hypothetical protein [Yinghuangia soli]MCF2526944.1 hypothetical protein [Yinghuangia soli]